MTNERLLAVKNEYSKKTRDGKLIHVLVDEIIHLRAEVQAFRKEVETERNSYNALLQAVTTPSRN